MPVDVDAVWERLRELMPTHDCGRQLLPGASPPDVLVLVCPPCSFVATADPGWVAAVVAQAQADVAAPVAPPAPEPVSEDDCDRLTCDRPGLGHCFQTACRCHCHNLAIAPAPEEPTPDA